MHSRCWRKLRHLCSAPTNNSYCNRGRMTERVRLIPDTSFSSSQHESLSLFSARCFQLFCVTRWVVPLSHIYRSRRRSTSDVKMTTTTTTTTPTTTTMTMTTAASYYVLRRRFRRAAERSRGNSSFLRKSSHAFALCLCRQCALVVHRPWTITQLEYDN